MKAKPSPPVITLRPECAEDDALLFDLYASTREEELALTGWDQSTRTAFLNMQFKAMRQGYRSMFPRGQFSIVLANGQPVGRLVVDRRADELHVADIIVASPNRNRGIGASIMHALLQEAAETRKPVRLHVFKNSRAIGFYERLGFSRVGETEVNILMERRPQPRGVSEITPDAPAD